MKKGRYLIQKKGHLVKKKPGDVVKIGSTQYFVSKNGSLVKIKNPIKPGLKYGDRIRDKIFTWIARTSWKVAKSTDRPWLIIKMTNLGRWALKHVPVW